MDILGLSTLDIIDQINSCSKPGCECSEIIKLKDKLNTKIIYNGERSIDIILFEILFGSFIKQEQYDVYNRIISEKNEYNIYQVLMGRGKSSVITVLLAFRNMLFSKDRHNILLTMPKHLIKQSFDNFIKNYSCIMYNINLYKVVISRDTKQDDYKELFVQYYDDNSKNIIINR
jgi:hypothetical protein